MTTQPTEPTDEELRIALTYALNAITTMNAFLEDLRTSNPGWLGKMCLQRYDVMNEAFILTERAPAIIEAALRTKGIDAKGGRAA